MSDFFLKQEFYCFYANLGYVMSIFDNPLIFRAKKGHTEPNPLMTKVAGYSKKRYGINSFMFNLNKIFG